MFLISNFWKNEKKYNILSYLYHYYKYYLLQYHNILCKYKTIEIVCVDNLTYLFFNDKHFIIWIINILFRF